MLNLLTVQDSLSDETVIINIQIQPDSKQRNQRTALVTVGISGQVPVMLSGPFGQLNDLINQAWRSFGQSTSATPKNTIAEVQVEPTKRSDQSKSKPKKESILSLF